MSFSVSRVERRIPPGRVPCLVEDRGALSRSLAHPPRRLLRAGEAQVNALAAEVERPSCSPHSPSSSTESGHRRRSRTYREVLKTRPAVRGCCRRRHERSRGGVSRTYFATSFGVEPRRRARRARAPSRAPRARKDRGLRCGYGTAGGRHSAAARFGAHFGFASSRPAARDFTSARRRRDRSHEFPFSTLRGRRRCAAAIEPGGREAEKKRARFADASARRPLRVLDTSSAWFIDAVLPTSAKRQRR